MSENDTSKDEVTVWSLGGVAPGTPGERFDILTVRAAEKWLSASFALADQIQRDGCTAEQADLFRNCAVETLGLVGLKFCDSCDSVKLLKQWDFCTHLCHRCTEKAREEFERWAGKGSDFDYPEY